MVERVSLSGRSERAQPLLPDHKQPLTPADLGYYGLTDSKPRALQAECAAANSIEPFCYWRE